MDRPPPNPYQGRELDAVADAMHRRARDLLERRPRTAEEREALARDTAYLLLTAAAALEPGWYAPAQPEKDLSDQVGIAQAFGAWNQRLARSARYRVLVRAAHAALAGCADRWLRDTRVDDQAPSDHAQASDEGLQRMLELLDRDHASRPSVRHPPRRQ